MSDSGETPPAAPVMSFEDRVGAAVGRIPEWHGQAVRITCAAAPVASPTHRGVASDCARVERDGAAPVFLKVRHADMAGDVLPGMAQATTRAGRAGLGPEVVLEGAGLLGMAFLPEPWRYARVGDLQDFDVFAKVLGTVRRLHAEPRLGWRFSPFDRIADLAGQARASTAPLPDDIGRLLASADLIRDAVAAAGFDPAFCRNDGVASNIMLDGTDVRLVDFDLAGDNDPWFDVAALINEVCQFDADRRRAIEAYAGRCDERIFHRCRLYGAVDDLMWGLWGVTRAVTSRRTGIEFFKYGQWRLLHARTTIDSRDFETWLRGL